MFNPDIKLAKSTGIDLPIMHVYLAGRIAGNCMDKCTEWRKQIRSYYENYKPIYNGNPKEDFISTNEIIGYESYPIAFIDPLNSGESKTADALGLKSHLSSNLIYDKDLLSVKLADVIVANVEDYFEEGIEDLMQINQREPFDFRDGFYKLQNKILNRRENFGTICEIAWALYLQKPLILIVPEARKYIYENHPFAKRASVIVTSVEQLLKEKILNILYKSISGATY